MGEIPRGDLAQSLGGGWGHVLSSLPVVLGLSLWGLCLGILNKRGQRVPEEGAHGVSLGGYLLQLDEGELHVRALGDLVLIPGRWGGRRRGGRDTHTHAHTDCSAGCGGLGNGLLNPPWLGFGASAIPLVPCGS